METSATSNCNMDDTLSFNYLPYFLQITHYKRPTNSVVPFKPPSPPFNVDAGLIECHCEFRTTLIRGGGGEGE